MGLQDWCLMVLVSDRSFYSRCRIKTEDRILLLRDTRTIENPINLDYLLLPCQLRMNRSLLLMYSRFCLVCSIFWPKPCLWKLRCRSAPWNFVIFDDYVVDRVHPPPFSMNKKCVAIFTFDVHLSYNAPLGDGIDCGLESFHRIGTLMPCCWAVAELWPPFVCRRKDRFFHSICSEMRPSSKWC